MRRKGHRGKGAPPSRAFGRFGPAGKRAIRRLRPLAVVGVEQGVAGDRFRRRLDEFVVSDGDERSVPVIGIVGAVRLGALPRPRSELVGPSSKQNLECRKVGLTIDCLHKEDA